MSNFLFILLNTVKDASNLNWTAIGTAIAAASLFAGILGLFYKFGKLSERFKAMGDSINDISNTINKNTLILKSVTTYLVVDGAESGLFTSESPLKLNKLGEDVLSTSGGKEYIDRNNYSLITEIEGEHLKTALDVQNFSSSLLFQKTEDPGFNKIKSFIYNNPTYKNITINTATVISVMAIYLRDIYLEKYPDLLDG